MESRFFYDIQKNINDKIYNEYIKFCKDNVNVSDPNQIIQMLALKSRIVPTTDGTDHNLNNYIDTWIKDKMLSLINKFIPNPTAENIETFVDRLCKYLEVADICTRKNINLKLIKNPIDKKLDLIDNCNLEKIKITLYLKEKFKKIRSLTDKLEIKNIYVSSIYFDKLYDYVPKSLINEKIRSITPSKAVKDIKQSEFAQPINQYTYEIYNKNAAPDLNNKKHSRGESIKKMNKIEKNNKQRERNRKNISRSNSAPKTFENPTNESIKVSDFESYYIPNSDRSYNNNHSKLNKNGAKSYKRLNEFRFDKAIDALENEYNKLTGENEKLWRELKDLKDKFKTWRKWKNKNKLTIPDENYKNFTNQ